MIADRNPSILFKARALIVFFFVWSSFSRVSGASEKQVPSVFPNVFAANRGQADPQVRYISRANGYDVFLTSSEVALVLHDSRNSQTRTHPAVVRFDFPGGNRAPAVEGVDPVSGKANYLVGTDPSKWQTNVPLFQEVRWREVFPGIDVSFYRRGRDLEYDFVLAPGASSRRIHIGFHGVDAVALDSNGDVRLRADGETVHLHKPVAYQLKNGSRDEIAARYVISKQNELGIRLGPYDPRQTLIIDPVFSYATFLGGTGSDSATGVATDGQGNTYVTGSTDSLNFPIANPLQPRLVSKSPCLTFTNLYGTTTSPYPCSDAFVAKINHDGSLLDYVTYIGGMDVDAGTGIAVDSIGNAYVTGTTASADFPLSHPSATTGSSFILKLNSTGSALIYSTLFGGPGTSSRGIGVDSLGNAFITGGTSATNFPLIHPVPGGTCSSEVAPFVAELDATGASVVYSTCLSSAGPGVGNAIAVYGSTVFVTGQAPGAGGLVILNAAQPSPAGAFDAFVTALGFNGSLIYSTYLGGSQTDLGFGIAVDGLLNVYVTGSTGSDDFPTLHPFQKSRAQSVDNAFITKLDPTGHILYSSYLGGSGGEAGFGVAVDPNFNAYVTGRTASADFPVVNPIQSTSAGGTDVFVSEVNPTGSALLFSTYLGAYNAVARGIAVDRWGNASVVGNTMSGIFPVVDAIQPVFQGGDTGSPLAQNTGDAFVVKIGDLLETSATGFAGPPGTAISLVATSTNSSAVMGYGVFPPQSTPGTHSDALEIVDFRQNGVLVSEQSVPASYLMTSGRIYAEMSASTVTGLAFVNPLGADAVVSFYFTDPKGNNFGQGRFTVPANGQVTGFLNQLPFSNGVTNFQGTFSFAASSGVAALALRGFTNERGEFLTTTLPVVDPSSSTSGVVTIPQFADGGGWTTQILLVNTTDTAETGTVQFFGPSGVSGTSVSIGVGSQTSSTFSYTVAPRSSTVLQTSGAGTSVQIGSVVVTPGGGTSTPAGLLVFSFRDAGITVTTAGVPILQTQPAWSMYVEASSDIHQGVIGAIQSGFAIANPSATQPSTVQLQLTDVYGNPLPYSGTVNLPPQGQQAMFLSEIPGFQSLPLPTSGILRISTTSSAGLNVIGIRGRYNERGDFLMTTTPPVPAAGPGGGGYFPEFVVGGGYTTQVILFNGRGQFANSSLFLHSANGQTFTVAWH